MLTPMSPRAVTMYRDVRRRVLPVMVRESSRKANIDAKHTAAMNDFTQMIVPADDNDIADRAAMKYVKQPAEGFFRAGRARDRQCPEHGAAAPAANEPAPGIPAALAGGCRWRTTIRRLLAGPFRRQQHGPHRRDARPTSRRAVAGSAADLPDSDREVIPPTDLTRTILECGPPAAEERHASRRSTSPSTKPERESAADAADFPYYDSTLLIAAKQW
jgi:hypothetical protein